MQLESLWGLSQNLETSHISDRAAGKKRITSGVHRIHEQYKEVLNRVNAGESIIEALKRKGLARSTFYKWKPVAELKILDPIMFRHFRRNFWM